jgi:hypothetical protein
MEKLHHQTLKSAVSKYLPLKTEGKTEEEIRTAIASDEKGFTDENINEIYDAIINNTDNESLNQGDKPPASKKKKKYVVVTPFRDINDFSIEHREGKDVSHFDKGRLTKLVENGHVKLNDE